MGIESLHEESNDNNIKIIDFARKNNLKSVKYNAIEGGYIQTNMVHLSNSWRKNTY